MIVKKITHGYVCQTFDIRTNSWVSQEFTADNGETSWEDEANQPIESHFLDTQYLPFDMVQPPNTETKQERQLTLTYGEIFDRAGSFLEKLGINPWVINEGQATRDTTAQLSESQCMLFMQPYEFEERWYAQSYR